MKLLDRAIFKFFKASRTYSQAGEDSILSFLFNSYGREVKSYLDVGTNHPKMGNNTYLFYRNGARGVCVEPNPELARLISRSRPGDICVNAGVSAGESSDADFYVMSSHVLSTFSKEEALELDAAGKYKIDKVITVPLMNINAIMHENFSSVPDLVSIDVEGWNEEIIKSFDFNACRPFCFCVETITFSEDNNGKKLDGIFDVFSQNKYTLFADTRVNSIFVNNNDHR